VAHLESLVVLDAAGKSGAALSFGFERAGYKVYATRDGEDALAMAQTRVPQLVVVAVDGAEALSLVGRLREEAVTRELPVVAIGDRGRREEALRAGVDEFIARPAFIRDVLTLSRLAVAVRQDGDDGGVVGLLEDYGLYFLVRAIAVAGRSCVMELERGRRLGEVQVAKGAVVAARVGRMTGVSAFHHLLLWGEASLSLRFESPSADRRIGASVDELLELGARFAAEFEALSERVGGPQAVYAHEPRRAAEARAQIPAEVMVLVKQYDGRKPLIDIVEDSPFKPLDTIKITFRLCQLGAIVRKETRESTPLTERLAVRDWLLGDGDGDAASEPPRARPNGTPGGLTEAGRRAAEAYAAEAARREAVKSPADDILDDSAAVRAAAAKLEPKAPIAAKTAKKKKEKEKEKEAPPKKEAAAKREPPKKEAAKLSPQASAQARGKEPMFDAVDEEFFAREAELWHPPKPDTFDDLEPQPRGKRSPANRDWFGLKKK
jgi:CheY-like chemotaxis protein